MIEMKNTAIEINDTIEFSDEGIQGLTPRNPNRTGRCIGWSPDPNIIRVKWDGYKGTDSYHKKFIKKID